MFLYGSDLIKNDCVFYLLFNTQIIYNVSTVSIYKYAKYEKR